jgi:hypothetical protein
MILGVSALGMIGVGTELVLTEHTEGWRQWLPLVALGASLAALGWDAVSGGRASQRVLQLTMLGLMAAACAGLYMHYGSNEEFQREMDPDLGGWGLFLATMRAQSPPSLAPGVMGLLGALGLIATHGRKHTGNPK